MTEYRGGVTDESQLVLQLPEDAFVDFDAMVAFEDSLIEALGQNHEVDGHDIGSGEINFFIFTNAPADALDVVRGILHGSSVAPSAIRLAVRAVDSEDYEVLWPEGDTTPFAIR
jgi:hypothetical protein